MRQQRWEVLSFAVSCFWHGCNPCWTRGWGETEARSKNVGNYTASSTLANDVMYTLPLVPTVQLEEVILYSILFSTEKLNYWIGRAEKGPKYHWIFRLLDPKVVFSPLERFVATSMKQWRKTLSVYTSRNRVNINIAILEFARWLQNRLHIFLETWLAVPYLASQAIT